jgi:hypothetical protein
MAMTLAVPGYTSTIHFEGPSTLDNPHLKSFLKGNMAKYGLHLERLAWG